MTASSSIKISESLIKPEKVNISPTSYPNITVSDEKKLTNSKLAMSLVNKKETKLIKNQKMKPSQPPENFIKSQHVIYSYCINYKFKLFFLNYFLEFQ